MFFVYKILINIIFFCSPLILIIRLIREKEDPKRFKEKLGFFIKKRKIKNIYFIIGSDNLIRFHKWKSWKKIVKLVKLIVFSRKGYDRKGMKSIVVKNYKNKIFFIKNKSFTISSTQLKSQIRLNN